MVDVKFVSRAPHFVPLALLKTIAGGDSSDPPDEIGYIGNQGVKAVKGVSPSWVAAWKGKLSCPIQKWL